MSFDLTIKSDEGFSKSTPRQALNTFLGKLPGVKPNGTGGFLFKHGRKRWMEIDIELVNEEGDNIEVPGEASELTNCIRLHIPYAMLDGYLETHYLPVAFAVAKELGWPLYDDQTDEVLSQAPSETKDAPEEPAKFDAGLFIGDWIAFPYSFAPGFRMECKLSADGRFFTALHDASGKFEGSAAGRWAICGSSLRWTYQECKKVPRPRRPELNRILEVAENRFSIREPGATTTEFWRTLPAGSAAAELNPARFRACLESLIKPIEGGFATREIDQIMANAQSLGAGKSCEMWFAITEEYIAAPLRIELQSTKVGTLAVCFMAPVRTAKRIEEAIKVFENGN